MQGKQESQIQEKEFGSSRLLVAGGAEGGA